MTVFLCLDGGNGAAYLAVEHLIDIDFHPVTADDAACTEADEGSLSVGIVPVGEGHAAGSLVDVLPDEVGDAEKVVVVASQGCCPHFPVALGIDGSTVEGQAVGIELAEVEVVLLGLDLVGEESEAPCLVPYHVVLLAPGAGAVVGQFVVGAVLGELDPLACHLLCLCQVCGIDILFAAQVGKQGIACHAHDGLDCEVGVVCQVACEVVGAELVLWVCAVLYEVVGPCGEGLPVAVSPFCVAIDDGDGCCQDDDVGTLLDGHIAAELTIGAREALGIDLVVGMWIGAEVVCCEVEAPAVTLAIVEDGGAHALHQVGVVDEEEGC